MGKDIIEIAVQSSMTRGAVTEEAEEERASATPGFLDRRLPVMIRTHPPGGPAGTAIADASSPRSASCSRPNVT